MYRSLHPVHAFVLSGSMPLFLGALLADIAYFQSYEVQWKNFASWLIVGGLVFCAAALLWALIDRFRSGWRPTRRVVYLLMLLAAWICGFVNALTHAADAWASMPKGLVLSVITVALALAATWLGLGDVREGEAK